VCLRVFMTVNKTKKKQVNTKPSRPQKMVSDDPREVDSGLCAYGVCVFGRIRLCSLKHTPDSQITNVDGGRGGLKWRKT
jgi:hypothetical protein